MAEPAGSGYRSPVNLGLDQMPPVGSDPALFNQLVPIYNAIHILNAYLDALRLSLEGGDPDKPPDEEMRFVRGFWTIADDDIDQGKVVTIRSTGVKIGCGKMDRPGMYDSMFTGIALTTAARGEKVRVGVGPAILEITGFKRYDFVYSTPPGRDFAGEFMNHEAVGIVDGLIKIGFCVQDDFIMIFPSFPQMDWS